MRKLAGAVVLASLPFVSACADENYSVSGVHRMMSNANRTTADFVKGDMAYRSIFSDNGVLIIVGSRIRDQRLSRAKPNSPELANYFYNLGDRDVEYRINPAVSDIFARAAYTPRAEDLYTEHGKTPEIGELITPQHRRIQMELVQESGKSLTSFFNR